jgi:hypothetical protein
MTRLFLLVLMICAVALSGNLLPSTAKAPAPHKESAVVEFNHQVRLLGVFLKGRYLVVHDDEMMARGEACTFVYSLKGDRQDKLVLSFHCTPVAREKAESFTIRTVSLLPSLAIDEVREIQFAGSREGHLVPSD